MGVEGILEYLSDLLSKARRRKFKQLKTVALKVRMCCDGCVLKVKNTLSSMKGVKSVDVELKLQKVTVTGYVEPKKVLGRINKATKKSAVLWPYVPYNMVAHPYVAQAYDKKAPPGYVRAIDSSATITESTVDDKYITMFSDDNTNACSIM